MTIVISEFVYSTGESTLSPIEYKIRNMVQSTYRLFIMLNALEMFQITCKIQALLTKTKYFCAICGICVTLINLIFLYNKIG